MTPTIHLDKPLELPALEPSEGLLYEYYSAQAIYHFIKDGLLEYSAQSLKTWADTSLTNKRMFEATKRLLGKTHQLSEYKECFKEKYLKELDTPAGKASLLIVKANNAKITGLEDIIFVFE